MIKKHVKTLKIYGIVVLGACFLSGCLRTATITVPEIVPPDHTLILYDTQSEGIRQLADEISSLTGGRAVHLASAGDDIAETVYLGIDGWNGNIPQTIITYLAEHDLAGKTMIPFGLAEDAGAKQTDLLTAAFQSAYPAASVADSYLVTMTEQDQPVERDQVADWLAAIGQVIPITIEVDGTVLNGILYANPTAREFAALLPIETPVYEPADFAKAFNLTDQLTDPGSRTRAYQLGGLAYWPEGPAVAIFFSNHVERTVVPVYTLGRILDDVELFRGFEGKIVIKLQQTEE